MKRPAGGALSVVMKRVRPMRAQWLLLALIAGFASRGMAQCDYQVTSLADSGTGTLRAGIATAPTTTDICFSVKGTITLLSPLQINAPVTITGSNGVTISGNNSVGILVIDVISESSAPVVTISGLTLSGGNATAGNNIYGGAIWVQAGATALSNMTITGNTAESGGAIYSEDSVTIQNSTVSNNTATTGVGGAIANENSGATLTIQNTTISGNTSLTGSGGALDNSGISQVTGGTFQGNSANYGGAIDNETNATLTISGGTAFNSNIATLNGGAIENYGRANVTAALFNANQAQGNSDSVGCGGAICNESTLTVTESTFVANTTTGSGGGIESDSGTSITLQDDTISGNTAGYTGSGLDLEVSSSTPIVENTVIAGNTAILGQTNPDCFGCAAATQGGDFIGGTANLGPLTNNGGPTLTMMPLPAGNLCGTGVPGDTTDTTDQRGFSRLMANGAIDIGAVQSHYSSVSYSTQPSNTLINQTITPAVGVQVIEVDGKTTNYPQGVPVTVSLIPPAGVNATLSGTLTQLPTVVKGVTAALFPNLSVNAVGGFQLLATDAIPGNSGSADPIYSATSTTFQITPVVTLQWTPAPATYGPLPASELNASATVNGAAGTGTFDYTFVSSGATINVGQIYPVNSYSVQVAFTPTGSSTAYTLQTTLQITQAVPVLSWATPAPIYTSTALSATQLDATATGVTGAALPGTFVYTPAAGTKLTAGPQALSTTFTPTDATDYATATGRVTIQVNAVTASTAVIQTSANPITFGQSETFTAAVTGNDGNPFSGGTAAFTVDGASIGSAPVANGLASVTDASLTGGAHQVVLTYSNATQTLTNTITLTVNKASPTLAWATPAPIYTSTALSATQLDATATGVAAAALPGTFVYIPAAGTKLTAGPHTLSTTFTPNDATDYATATDQVTIQVNAVTASTAVIQESASSITFGQSETFTAVITGSDGNPFSGGTAAFTVDGASVGSAQVVNGLASVTDATPTGGTHQVVLTYTNATQTLTGNATLTVNKASPTLAWATPAPIYTSTALSATQLDATATGVTGASLPGTAVYNPPAGTLLTNGAHVLSVVFTPTDAVDYTTATTQVTIAVSYTPLSISAITPSTVTLSTTTTTVAITGSGFTATTVAELNGTPLPTTVSGATGLSATIAPSVLTAVGVFNLTAYDSTSKLTSNALALTVTVPPVDLTVTPPQEPTSGEQPVIGLVLNTAYPTALAGTMTLSFTPGGSNGVDDPAVQFATGGRTLTFTVPAASTTTPQVALQTGTVAGTINVTLSLQADGVDVTPAGVSPITLNIKPAVPVITSVTFTNSATGQLTVVINGYSNTRDMSGADFNFTGTGANSLSSATASVTVSGDFTPWYTSTTSDQYGSEFSYAQSFQLSQPDSGITGVSVTLTNSIGTSESVSSQ
jgi:predicted outer membrane repeat protein